MPMLFVITFLGNKGAGVVLVETAADDFLDDTGELEEDFLCWNGELAGSAISPGPESGRNGGNLKVKRTNSSDATSYR